MNSSSQNPDVDFTNTEVAFAHLSNRQLWQAYLLFKVIGQPLVVQLGPSLTDLALKFRLPIKSLVRQTIFSHFCGGETIKACQSRIAELGRYGIGTILDFAREGAGQETDFDLVRDEIKRTIDVAGKNKHVPFAVFKPTGVAKLELLAKIERKEKLSKAEEKSWQKVQARFRSICAHAHHRGVRIMIDAEESWIQETVDHLASQLMQEFNQEQAIVFNTVQLYRQDRLSYLQKLLTQAEKTSFFVGVKLVRGAYLEKENAKARTEGYPTPINPSKNATDKAYDDALRFCMQHIEKIAIVAGTHNEESTRLLTKLLQEQSISQGDQRVFFSQLLGMSDQLSFNLAAAGYNVAKYVPYGKVEELLPYLTRRAQENSSVAGQTSRELKLLEQELKRRRSKTSP